MAVNFDVKGGSRTSEYRLPPEAIQVKPELNGRYKLPEIDSLVADMLSKPDGHSIKGQVTPVVIRKDGTQPVLVAGHRRYRAVQFINENNLAGAPMLLRCVYTQANDVEALAIAVSENRERVGVEPLDEAYCIKQFLRLGKTEGWIAVYGGFFPGLERKTEKVSGDGVPHKRGECPEFDKALRWVRKRAALLNLTPEAEKAVEEGKVSETAAEHLAKLSAEQQKKLVESADGKIKPEDIRGAAGLGKPKKLGAADLKKALAAAAASKQITVSGGVKYEIPLLVCEWILELLNQA